MRSQQALAHRVIVSAVAAVLLARPLLAQDATEWPVTGGAPGGGRFSPLSHIDRTNVHQLRLAWTYRHGDVRSGGPLPSGGFQGTAFEATPIVVDGRLIISTPFNRVIALDPETGRELWTFDPKLDRGRRFANLMISRGVAHWRRGPISGPCPKRVFLGTLDARLIALDAETGRPCPDFGQAGTVDLLDGIEHLADAWEYNVTSPPTVVGNIVLVGSSIADVVRRVQPSGAVRAYDARTGRLLWRFNTIPQAGEFGRETWERESWRGTGGANVWSTMTVDLERGLVFLPVSSAGPDFFGGDRPGMNLFANSVVALDARTGRRVWHFQAGHHDLWDNDPAAPPLLVTLRRDGRALEAVAVLTKTGFLFVLDRESGAPLFPIEERPAPASDVPGEKTWPTQPFPVRPPPLVPQCTL
jgi:quinoprotein glucose dehydrogenase